MKAGLQVPTGVMISPPTARHAPESDWTIGTSRIDLSLSLSRRYATSTSVDPTTEFGFRVSLTGVGDRGGERIRRGSCRG